ncbi:hypothetical protein Tco_0861853, partial [Tanacetum coccineum]
VSKAVFKHLSMMFFSGKWSIPMCVKEGHEGNPYVSPSCQGRNIRRGIKVVNAGTIFSDDVAHMDVGLLIDVLTWDVPLSMIRKHLRMKVDFAT